MAWCGLQGQAQTNGPPPTSIHDFRLVCTLLANSSYWQDQPVQHQSTGEGVQSTREAGDRMLEPVLGGLGRYPPATWVRGPNHLEGVILSAAGAARFD